MGGLKASEHGVMGWGSCLGKITSWQRWVWGGVTLEAKALVRGLGDDPRQKN